MSDIIDQANELAARMGETPNAKFVALLHEMEEDMQISFGWLRGYKL